MVSTKSKNPKKSDQAKEIISPSTQTIKIEHKFGKESFIQKLTIPRHRRFKNVYQLKCTLMDTKPPVWRRIQVPENYTFYDFHVALQDAMNWLDYHLHCFRIPGIGTFEEIAHIECPWLWEPWDMDKDWLTTTEVPLKDYLNKPSDKAIYCYDYGDSWQMNVKLEKILPKTKNTKYPICLGGKLAAPPEDCGSIPGYYQCIEAFEASDKFEEQHGEENEDLGELITWLGDWNPYRFDPEKIIFESPRERFIMALDLE